MEPNIALVRVDLGCPYGAPWPILASGSAHEIDDMRDLAVRLLSQATGAEGDASFSLLLLRTRRRVQAGRKTKAGAVLVKWSAHGRGILEQ